MRQAGIGRLFLVVLVAVVVPQLAASCAGPHGEANVCASAPPCKWYIQKAVDDVNQYCAKNNVGCNEWIDSGKLQTMWGIASCETRFQSWRTSSTGAKGLFQITPSTLDAYWPPGTPHTDAIAYDAYYNSVAAALIVAKNVGNPWHDWCWDIRSDQTCDHYLRTGQACA